MALGELWADVFARRAVGWESRDAGNTVAAGLALSGGGYRAMLFHAGALRRLHELELLSQLARISSVSGGSIASAMLARAWPDLARSPGDPEVYRNQVELKLMKIASTRIDVSAVLTGLVSPRRSIAEQVARRFEVFFPRFTLQQLPDGPGAPRFVFCSTNLGSGALVRFSKAYTADHRIGKRDGLDLPISAVIAASAAFPPFLSPFRLDLKDTPLSEQFDANRHAELAGQGFDRVLELSDGGVYDNLGLQPLEQYHTVFVSDGGGPFLESPIGDPDWLRQIRRAWTVTDRQVRALRRSGLVQAFTSERRRGAYWGISTAYSDFGISSLGVHPSWARYLAAVPTRLHPIQRSTQCLLINFGYALADAAVRSHVVPDVALPEPSWPYTDHTLERPSPGDYDPPRAWALWRSI